VYATSKTASAMKGILVPDRVYTLSFSAPQIMTFWLNEHDLLSRILILSEPLSAASMVAFFFFLCLLFHIHKSSEWIRI
jgi:uncharacterized membrane protein